MPQGSEPYPISALLQRLIEQHGPSKSEFVQSLGYRNIERGLHRLELWLEQGDGFEKIIHQISKTFPDSADELKLAIAATNAIKHAEAEAVFLERCKAEEPTFVPYIHCQGETTTPSGITIFGVTGGHRRWTTIQVPEAILDMPIEEQLARVPELMAAYVQEFKGACPFFGKLVGFRYVRLLDYFQFDSDGKFVEYVEKPYRQGYVSVFLR